MTSRSNGEAEYKALTNATIEIMWIRILLKELEVQNLEEQNICFAISC